MVRFMTQQLYLSDKGTCYLLNRMLGGPHSQSERTVRSSFTYALYCLSVNKDLFKLRPIIPQIL
jgi:hypothetical protein